MKNLVNIALVLLSVVVALLLLEAGLRMATRFMPNSQPDPRKAQAHLYDPYRSHRLNPDFSTPTNTEGHRIHSPDGFRRDTPVDKNKAPGTIRIIMMGGSALYGSGSFAPYPAFRYLRNNETIPARLEAMLNARLTHNKSPYKVEVLNCGLVAYLTYHHLVYLNESLLEYRPDIVINFDGNNDFYIDDPNLNHWEEWRYATKRLVDAVNDRSFVPALHTFIRWLSNYSLIAAQIEKRYTLPAMDNYQSIAPLARAASVEQDYAHLGLADRLGLTARRSYLRALWQIKMLGQLEGYEHAVFLQPEIVLEEPERLSEHDKKILKLSFEIMPPEQVAVMQQARALFPGLFRSYGIAFHDVASITADGGTPKEDLYLDYCHLTPAGTQAVAKLMLPDVLELVRRKTLTMQ